MKTKRRLLRLVFLTYLFFVFTGPAFSQISSYVRGAQAELFAGPSTVRQYGSPSVNKYTVFMPGYVLGIGFNRQLARHLDLSLKIMYEQKGGKLQSTDPESSGAFNNPPNQNLPPVPTTTTLVDKNGCVTFSLGPRYKIGRNAKWTVSLAGFYSLVNTATTTFTASQQGQNKVNTTASNGNQKNSDSGVSLVVSYAIFHTSKFALSVQLMENLGLYNTLAMPSPGNPQWYEKTNALAVMVVVGVK